MVRQISLFLRRRKEQKREREVLHQFNEWRNVISSMPLNGHPEKKLAIVRLDDIGDYLLWRNQLNGYRESARFSAYSITVIGNVVWKEIFETFDKDSADDVIWVDKHKYFAEEHYRIKLWNGIRAEHFSAVVCPSHTRPLLLDDMILLAAGAPVRIGVNNTFESIRWNTASDALYNELFPGSGNDHEGHFNHRFSEWIAQKSRPGFKLCLPVDRVSPEQKEVICFIGASAKSKKWPVEHWIEMIKLLKENGYAPVLSGGRVDSDYADSILSAIQVPSIVGRTNLLEAFQTLAGARAIVTGDTMAAHAGVALNKPTIILANGVNALRFVDYEAAGYKNVKTIYARQYLEAVGDKRTGMRPYRAVSGDMKSIQPALVMKVLEEMLNR